MHPSARTEYAQRELMMMLAGLSLTGNPAVAHADEVDRSTEAGPWVRVTFDEMEPRPAGRFDDEHSATEMGVLVTVDVFWPLSSQQTAPNLWEPDAAANEIRNALTHLNLPFREYSTPATPTEVAGARLRCLRPPIIRRMKAETGRNGGGARYRRRQVRAVVTWHARFTAPLALT